MTNNQVFHVSDMSSSVRRSMRVHVLGAIGTVMFAVPVAVDGADATLCRDGIVFSLFLEWGDAAWTLPVGFGFDSHPDSVVVQEDGTVIFVGEGHLPTVRELPFERDGKYRQFSARMLSRVGLQVVGDKPVSVIRCLDFACAYLCWLATHDEQVCARCFGGVSFEGFRYVTFMSEIISQIPGSAFLHTEMVHELSYQRVMELLECGYAIMVVLSDRMAFRTRDFDISLPDGVGHAAVLASSDMGVVYVDNAGMSIIERDALRSMCGQMKWSFVLCGVREGSYPVNDRYVINAVRRATRPILIDVSHETTTASNGNELLVVSGPQVDVYSTHFSDDVLDFCYGYFRELSAEDVRLRVSPINTQRDLDVVSVGETPQVEMMRIVDKREPIGGWSALVDDMQDDDSPYYGI